MRKTGLLLLAVGAAMTFFADRASAQCGAFNLWQGDDFCLKCPSARPVKLYMCPGGPAGMAVATTSHPNCSVTFYDASCGDQVRRKKPR
jgi:hypothetical protein